MFARELTIREAVPVILTGAMAAAQALLAPSTATAQTLADAKQPVLEQTIPTLSKRDCIHFFSVTESVLGDARKLGELGRYNRELPITLANLMAPSNPTLVLGFLTKGGFAELMNSQAPADLATREALKQALTCTGSKEIVTSGAGIDVFNEIRRRLLLLPQRIDLDAYAIKSVGPQVGSLRPEGPFGLGAAKKGPRLN